MGDQNPRFKGENILVLELDLPDRTTYDYDGVESISEAQTALNAVLSESNQTSILPLDDIGNNVGTFKDDLSPVLHQSTSSKKKRIQMRRMSSFV